MFKITSLFVCDLQNRVVPQMINYPIVSKNIKNLINYSNHSSNFKSIVIASLLPEKLGDVHNDIKLLCNNNPKVINYIKSDYSMIDLNMLEYLETEKIERIILTGVQTEWCITQTALDLKNKGYEVVVLKDAVASTNLDRHNDALEYLKNNNIEVTLTHNWIVRRLRLANKNFNDWYISVLKDTNNSDI